MSPSSRKTLPVRYFPLGLNTMSCNRYHVLLLNPRDASVVRRLNVFEQDENSRNDVTIERFFFSSDGMFVGVVADGSQQAWAIEGNQAWSDRRSLDLPLVDGELDGILPVVSSAASQGSVIVDVRTGKELTRVFAGKDVRVCGADERTVFVTLCDGRRIWLYETGSTEAALKDFDDVSSDGALGVSNAERTVEI
jgi:hypothetical protein